MSKLKNYQKLNKPEKIFLLTFLHIFVERKLNQTRCVDPYIWSRIFDYIKEEIILLEETDNIIDNSEILKKVKKQFIKDKEAKNETTK